jgi:5-methyltetrahydrofolate--homocysteine methyltransferase
MSDINAILENLMAGEIDTIQGTTQKALDAGVAPVEILNNALIAGMDIVGEKMQSGDMFIPEVLMAAQAMSSAIEILTPLLSEGEASKKGTVIIGTVKGDLHDIGKNLVSMMLGSSGFEVIDLGVDVPPETFVSSIKEKGANILCLSALLTTTMPMMKQTVDAITENGLRDSVKILVGGAPVNQDFADEIGVDGYAPDAGSASKLAKTFLPAA